MGESPVINRVKPLLFYAGIANLSLGVLFGITLTIIRFIEMGKHIKLLQKRLADQQSNLEMIYDLHRKSRI